MRLGDRRQETGRHGRLAEARGQESRGSDRDKSRDRDAFAKVVGDRWSVVGDGASDIQKTGESDSCSSRPCTLHIAPCTSKPALTTARKHSAAFSLRCQWRPVAQRRGAILFEMLLSIAIFAGASLLTLSVIDQAYQGLARQQQQQLAIDLARSKMSELEAGVIAISELDGSEIDNVGSFDIADFERSETAGETFENPNWMWAYEIDTQSSAFTGLMLVELTVYSTDPEFDEDSRAEVTLLQLLPIGDDPPSEYKEDELMRGLGLGGGE